MSEFACHTAEGEALVYYTNFRNTSDSLGGDFLGKAMVFVYPESTMSLFSCFRDASPAH